jgi:hypothetical protein
MTAGRSIDNRTVPCVTLTLRHSLAMLQAIQIPATMPLLNSLQNHALLACTRWYFALRYSYLGAHFMMGHMKRSGVDRVRVLAFL